MAMRNSEQLGDSANIRTESQAAGLGEVHRSDAVASMKRKAKSRRPSAIIERVFQRRAAAYHEAGHAVIAMWHGWSVGPEGVEIDRRDYAGFLIPNSLRDRERAQVTVCQAGWLSEHKWHGRGGLRTNDALLFVIDAVRRDDSDLLLDYGADDADVFALMLRLRPDATDEALVAHYRDYHQQTARMLNEVWFGIERLAAALLKRGKISSKLAHRLTGFPEPR